MASAFTHAFVGTVVGKFFKQEEKMPGRFWAALAVCAALPDIDVIGHWLGVPYDSPWGHRGFTHSFFFAAVTAFFMVWALFRPEKRWAGGKWALWTCFFIATASHGILDAFTNGGHGIAFFWPFSNERYFFPWRPIEVSPLSVGRFWGERAVRILVSEFLWVWLPTIVMYVIYRMARGSAGRRPKDKGKNER